MSDMELSKYELERVRNIEANNLMLAKIGLLGPVSESRSPRPRQRSARPKEPTLPLRNSTRSTKGSMPARLVDEMIAMNNDREDEHSSEEDRWGEHLDWVQATSRRHGALFDDWAPRGE